MYCLSRVQIKQKQYLIRTDQQIGGAPGVHRELLDETRTSLPAGDKSEGRGKGQLCTSQLFIGLFMPATALFYTHSWQRPCEARIHVRHAL